MSKKNRDRRERNRQEKTARYSTLEAHKREGSQLIAPMMTIPNMQPSSWRNQRLPEVLWAAILVSHLPREMALDIFRPAAMHALKLRDPRPGDITHSGITVMPPEVARDLLQTICRDDYARKFLWSLSLLEELPGRQLWMEFLTGAEDHASWDVLARAIAFTLDHQSQESTDCRWLKVIFTCLKGQLHFPKEAFGTELVEENRNYPNHGDMRKVRPSIRATEGALELMGGHSDWPNRFWAQCLRDTGCSPLPVTAENQLTGRHFA